MALDALWKVPESDLALVALLSSEVVPTLAAACVHVTLLGHRANRTASALLAAGGDVMAPVVGCTAVAPLSHGVGGADALSSVSIAVVSHMTASAWCAASLLEVKVSSGAAVTLGSAHSGLTTALARLITIKGLRAKGVTVTGNAHATSADAVGLRHTFITLSANNVLSALALTRLMVAHFRCGPIHVALARLAVPGRHRVPIVAICADVTDHTSVARSAAQTLACDWVTALR